MAFDRQSFFCVGPDAGMTRIWAYQTTDGPATIGAANYFRAARDEVRVGDLIYTMVLASDTVDRLMVYFVSSRAGGTVVIENLAGSSTSSDAGLFNVRDEGAKADFSTACLAAFQAAAAKCTTRGSIVVVGESFEAVGVPGYLLAGNWLTSLGTAANAIPGCTTELHGRLLMQAGPVIVPPGHTIVGDGGVPTNVASPTGSEIWAVAAYTGTGNRLVMLGPDNGAPQHTKLKSLTVNGRSVANIIGIYSNCVQEACGLFDTVVINCHHGIIFAAAASISPANFAIERSNVVMTTANPGNGMDIFGGNARIENQTVVNTHSTTTGDTACILRGSNLTVRKLHCEGFDYGIDIGGPSTGVGDDIGFWSYNISAQTVSGFCLSTQPGLMALARIRNNDTHVFNVALNDLSINTLYPWAATTAYTLGQRHTILTSSTVQLECTTAGTSGSVEPAAGLVGATVADGSVVWTYVFIALVQDDVNGVVIPATATILALGSYEFAGTRGIDSGGAVKRPVYTSYYDRLAPPNRALKAMPITGTTDLDRSFVGGGRAGIVQVIGTATPVLRTISHPRTGDVVYLHILSGSPVLDHAAVAGTAAERLLCSTGADIAAAVGQYYCATYGDIRGAAIDAVNYASRWYVEPV